MKLINKISRYFFLSSILVFIILSVGLYFIIEYSFTDETDEQLLNISKKVVQELQNDKAVNFTPFVEVTLINQNEVKSDEFKSILINSEDEDGEPFRELTSFANVKGNQYKIICRVSLLEKEDLILSISAVTIATIFIFFLILYFLNKRISQNILKDFYSTINKLENFSVKRDENFSLAKSGINEFEKLNKSILSLTKKAKNEYRGLKEFSEELNHEIQTPIAVVKSKLENILQSSSLKEETVSGLDIAIRNLNKLERINKSILLLNKLEQKDLFDASEISLTKEIKNVVETYSDFISSKGITINLSLNGNVVLKANHSLINILLSNLLSNSIKHNIPKGNIIIELKYDKLTFTNTGSKPKNDTQKYFERFYKESESAESIGLGLTIVKKICDLYGYEINNNFQDSLYSIVLEF
ncbi:MAG: HAMP domain-containing histidine kinase [Ignavibacteriales bacterium]|nr:HAMP domain-containing histidine kinase [Ignavibacteriales bacterium]MCB9219914.1 HAMP domain-containing histidine kinase [Ignavibacteriales bacterium]